MKKRWISKKTGLGKMFLLIPVILLFTGGPARGADWPKDVTVISPAPGASVHMVLVGVGGVVQKYTPIENWIVQPLGGPKLWLPMMKGGQCHFANHSAADILNAFLGRGLYAKMGPMPVRTVGAGGRAIGRRLQPPARSSAHGAADQARAGRGQTRPDRGGHRQR